MGGELLDERADRGRAVLVHGQHLGGRLAQPINWPKKRVTHRFYSCWIVDYPVACALIWAHLLVGEDLPARQQQRIVPDVEGHHHRGPLNENVT